MQAVMSKTSLNPESWVPNPAFADRLRANVDLSRTNWFRVGGRAEWLFKPDSAQDLANFLSLLPPDVPVTVLGVGSNIIVRDDGIDGVVIKLGRGFVDARTQGTNLSVGAAVLSLNAAYFAADNGIAGLEFLSGIPGTIGGVVRMNGGAYGSDAASVLVGAEVVDRNGAFRRLSNKDLGFTYRESKLPPDSIVTAAVFQGKPGNKKDIEMRMQKITEERESTQPIRSRTGGSTFKNPDGHKAWELIDKAGCRGLTIGGAQVSEKHCNFLINTGSATAADLENLGEEVRKRVREKTGIELEWEIKRIGRGKTQVL